MVRFYMDVHVPGAVTRALRLHDVDVLTAQEDGTAEWQDPPLLDRATALDRVLFSEDDDLLVEAARRQEQGELFAGVIYMHQLDLTIGRCVTDLELLAKAGSPEDYANQVWYLPLP
jgi:predicted nuclease of predicted toxin-antitoxin system